MRIRPLIALLCLLGTIPQGALAQDRPAVVELQTNLGTIALELDYAKAPVTSDNFIRYVRDDFYTDVLFHRVVKDFVIQGGGFARADGKQKATFAPIANEANNGLRNRTGTIAMARTIDPNSATSQFFINLTDNTELDYASSSSPGYAVFGKVIKGLPVVQAIGALPTFREFPFSGGSTLVWIEAVYTNDAWDANVSDTRITIRGSGSVVSEPPGIDCGTSCDIRQSKGATLVLKTTPATGFAFSGWSGDCSGWRRSITIDTTKGNHNCTAQFSRVGASKQ
jgi:peptidyl-prolyl cis-trans isomerase A (cyclophilin A)